MNTTTFLSIKEEIKKDNSLSDIQRERLLLFIQYIESTKSSLLENITPKRISEITDTVHNDEKRTIIDIWYYLGGKKWHLLDPIYRYQDEYSDEPIELEEDEVSDIINNGYIFLNNGNIKATFDPSLLFITFTLSPLSRELKATSERSSLA
ncbi:hypothetical protein [Neisseria montereyensis]|uniref:Uncharacterized protein n=1 Tax=Neisseria montereyensis TaxID=2973938 RepID=A0ABT2FBH0_9NEIS|nr:hypothetical protein [Neisseria montereyensis]MCS4533311.1 hypothetical protein [Neisseria montereyensis]